MKQVIYYEANDGKRFESEWECTQYEFGKGLVPIAETLMMWDGNGSKIDITHSTSLDKAYTIYCSSITAAIFLKEWGERDWVSTPYTNVDIENGDEVPLGTFIWFGDKWRTINKVIEQFGKIKHQMELGEEEIALPREL